MRWRFLWRMILMGLVLGAGVATPPPTAGRIGHVLRLLDLARDRCPDDSGSSHPRHTYYNNESRWTYTRQSGCTKYVASQMYIAYENSIGQLKYAHNGCNWFVASFPNNTQLLRPYVLHSMGGEQLQMVGDAD